MCIHSGGKKETSLDCSTIPINTATNTNKKWHLPTNRHNVVFIFILKNENVCQNLSSGWWRRVGRSIRQTKYRRGMRHASGDALWSLFINAILLFSPWLLTSLFVIATTSLSYHCRWLLQAQTMRPSSRITQPRLSGESWQCKHHREGVDMRWVTHHWIMA